MELPRTLDQAVAQLAEEMKLPLRIQAKKELRISLGDDFTLQGARVYEGRKLFGRICMALHDGKLDSLSYEGKHPLLTGNDSIHFTTQACGIVTYRAPDPKKMIVLAIRGLPVPGGYEKYIRGDEHKVSFLGMPHPKEPATGTELSTTRVQRDIYWTEF